MKGIKNTELDFWLKVKQIGKCRIWIGSKDKHGYGEIQYKGKKWATHRLAYHLVNGSIPDGMDILHKCDNPPCCKPEHLFPGTQKDNVDDMMKKGRNGGQFEKGHVNNNPLKGEDIAISRLTEREVLEARGRHATGKIGHKLLAKEYNMAASTMRAVLTRKTWKHI
jgi:hypothetical protein